MATNFVQDGKTIPHTAGADIAAGDVVVKGNIIGVAVADIANGAVGPVAVEGVFTLPKVAAAVIAAGEKLLWDVSAGKFDDSAATPATGDISEGAIAWEAGIADQTTIKAKIGILGKVN